MTSFLFKINYENLKSIHPSIQPGSQAAILIIILISSFFFYYLNAIIVLASHSSTC